MFLRSGDGPDFLMLGARMPFTAVIVSGALLSAFVIAASVLISGVGPDSLTDRVESRLSMWEIRITRRCGGA